MEQNCPSCDTDTLHRYKAPKLVGGMIFRRHRCRTCRRIVPSVQMMLSSESQMEEALELAIRRSRGSGLMQSSGDEVTLGTLALLDSLST